MKNYFIITLLFVILPILGCLAPEEESFTHSIEYSVSLTLGELVGKEIKPSKIAELENVTLLVPLPAIDGKPVELRNMTIPEGWMAEIVETSYGVMLKLSGEKVKTWKMAPMPVPIEDGKTPTVTPTMVKRAADYKFELKLELEREINTLDPLSGEYVLQPKYDLREVNCTEEYLKHYKYVKCYDYSTMLFFSSYPKLNASIYVSLEGRNEWFQMGWTGNEFYDHILAFVTSEGWKEIKGRLETGMGRYLTK